MSGFQIFMPKIPDDVIPSIYDDETPAAIWEDVQLTQDKCRTNLITKKQFNEAIHYLKTLPFGLMYVAGFFTEHGQSYSKQTMLEICWYTHRHKKYIIWNSYRCDQLYSPYTGANHIMLNLTKSTVMKHIFPQRYKKLIQLLIMHTFKYMHCKYPEADIIDIPDIDYGMILATSYEGYSYLCSPLSIKCTSRNYDSVKEAVKALNMELPSAHTWEKMQPYWILNAIE